MNSLYETIKKNGTGRGEGIMWQSVEVISKAVDAHMPEEERDKLIAEVYGLMSGKHYNEEFAMRCVSGLYYIDKAGTKHYAPYWTTEQVRALYEDASDDIPDYNEWDFFVTFNMLASNNWILFHKWWPDITPEDFAQKVSDASVAWLTDPDWNGDSKIWCYMHMDR